MSSQYECSICLDPFTEPKILPCFHTFCKNCLDGLINAGENAKKANKIVCPNCRSEIEIPKEGASGFSNNFYLCENDPVDRYYCDIHSEEIKFYCLECREAICASCCVVLQHKQHSTVDLKDVNHDIRSSLESLQNKLRNKIDQLKLQSDLLSRKLTAISELSAAACDQIDWQVEQICTELKETGQRYKQEINEMLAEDKEKLETDLTKVNNLINRLQMGVDCSRDVLSRETIKPLVDMIPNIEQLTEDCRDVDVGLPEVRHCHFIATEIDSEALKRQLGEVQTHYEATFTVSFLLEEIRETDKKYESEISVIGGLSWCVAVQRLSNSAKLGVYLHLKKGSDTTIRSSTVNQKMVLVHTGDSSKRIVKSKRSAVYEPEGSCWGWRFIEWDKLVDPVSGFTDDEGRFSVQTRIKITDIRRSLL